MSNTSDIITTREQAQAHLHEAIQPALVHAGVDWSRDVATLDEPILGNEVLVGDRRYWQFSFAGGAILDSHPNQWLAQDGRLIFTQHSPPDNDLEWPETFDGEIHAAIQALDESGEVLALSPAPPVERDA